MSDVKVTVELTLRTQWAKTDEAKDALVKHFISRIRQISSMNKAGNITCRAAKVTLWHGKKGAAR